MTNEQIKQEVDHIFASGANEVRVCTLIEFSLRQLKDKVPMDVVKKYKEWKSAHPDEDYQYDEIHDFISDLTRGDLVYVFEALSRISE